MEIVKNKRSSLSILALIVCIFSFFIAAMELILIGMETVLESNVLLFFTSPGDPIFETTFLDHVIKSLVNIVIGGIFFMGFLGLRKGTLKGFSFLIGGGILALGIGLLFVSIWFANLIDTTILGITNPGVWKEFCNYKRYTVRMVSHYCGNLHNHHLEKSRKIFNCLIFFIFSNFYFFKFTNFLIINTAN